MHRMKMFLIFVLEFRTQWITMEICESLDYKAEMEMCSCVERICTIYKNHEAFAVKC